jgi:hypothetical protein
MMVAVVYLSSKLAQVTTAAIFAATIGLVCTWFL